MSSLLLDAERRVVDQLLSAGANPAITDEDGKPSLHASVGNPGFANALYVWHAARLPIDLPDRLGHSALHYAAHNGYHEIVAALLNAGASPSLPNAEGKTPLDLARVGSSRDTRSNHSSCVDLLEGGVRQN